MGSAEIEIRGLISVLQGQIERIAGRLDQTDTQNTQIIADVRYQIQNIATANQNPAAGPRKEMRLLSDKDVKPQFFNGGPKEDFKEWAKKTKTFLNLKCDTFRVALTWAECQTEKIDHNDHEFQSWRDRDEGNPKLHDYLCSVLDYEPLNIVERTPGNGLEAWRRLNARFDPHGGQHDMERYKKLIFGNPKVQKLSNLPRIIEAWEKEVDNFTSRTSDFRVEDYTKVMVVLEMLPDAYAHEMKIKYNSGKRDYGVIRDDIMQYCSLNHHPKIYNGPKPMDLSPMSRQEPEEEKWSEEEWKEWVYDEQNPDSELDYLGKPRKGKGKGKGKKGKGKGKGTEKGGKSTSKAWDAAKIKQYEEDRCFICDGKGHRANKCPQNPAKDLKALDTEDEQDRAIGLGADLNEREADLLEREITGIDRGCDSFEIDDIRGECETEDMGDEYDISPLDIDLSYEHEGRSFNGKSIGRMHTAMSEGILQEEEYQRAEFQSPPTRTTTTSPSTTSPTAEMFRREMEAYLQSASSMKRKPETEAEGCITPEKDDQKKVQAQNIDPKLSQVNQHATAKEEIPDLLDLSPPVIEFQPVKNKWKTKRQTKRVHQHSFYDSAATDFEQATTTTRLRTEVTRKSECSNAEAQTEVTTIGMQFFEMYMIDESNQKMTNAERKNPGKASLQLSGETTIVEGKDPGKAGLQSRKTVSVEGKEPGKASPHSPEEITEETNAERKDPGKASLQLSGGTSVVEGKDPGKASPQPPETDEASRHRYMIQRCIEEFNKESTVEDLVELDMDDDDFDTVSTNSTVLLAGVSLYGFEKAAKEEQERDTEQVDPDDLWSDPRKLKEFGLEGIFPATVPRGIIARSKGRKKAEAKWKKAAKLKERKDEDNANTQEQRQARSEHPESRIAVHEHSNVLLTTIVFIVYLVTILDTVIENFTFLAIGLIHKSQRLNTIHRLNVFPKEKALMTFPKAKGTKEEERGKIYVKKSVRERLAKMFRIRRGLTVDSGAADSVYPSSWIKAALIMISKGFREGLHYIAASGTRIPNQGEFNLKFWTKEGAAASLIFQVANINKPLMSVSHATDNDYCVVFNKHEGVDVSYILHKPTDTVMRLRRERGFFLLDAWTEEEIGDKTTSFIRPS